MKSAYRAYKTQKTMYNNRLERNNGKDDGWVSKPGASDHQTGLGCDVVPGSWKDKSMNSNMASTPECQWMAEHCYEYIASSVAPSQPVTSAQAQTQQYWFCGVAIS